MEKLYSSDAKAELLMLFHDNPGLIDRIEGVARRIGRTASEIEADVKDLIDLGVLVKKKIGRSEVVYFDGKKENEIQEVFSNKLKRGEA